MDEDKLFDVKQYVTQVGPRAGIAEISTRVRLARSQNVLAVAEMSDGSVRSHSVSVIVTLGACLEEIWTD